MAKRGLYANIHAKKKENRCGFRREDEKSWI